MKQTPVSVVSELSTMKALVVPENTPLTVAVERFSSNEGQHGIFLTDAAGRFSAVVDNRDLLNWARVQFNLSPGEVPLPVGKTRRLLNAKLVRDLAMPDSKRKAVHLTDTLAEALNRMARHDLEDIAVLDADGHVVNDLRLSEVLAFALRLQA
ncbi:MAG: CBS domain-containing protein [Caldilineaceae bacterium]|nr:CBS domain-containing protein [Caldilineaceae bacterium]